MVQSVVALLIVLLLGANAAFAEGQIFKLFKDKGGYLGDYETKVQELEVYFQNKDAPPVTLQFSKGLQFTVYGFLGKGFQNLILDIGNGQVLRIRKNKRRIFAPWLFFMPGADISPLVDSLGIYIAGSRFFNEHAKKFGEENRVRTPLLQTIPGHENEFLILEKIEPDFFYQDYFDKDFAQKNKKSAEEMAKIDAEFLAFVRTTAGLEVFGDFRGAQLAYSKKEGWVLLDFSNQSEVWLSGKVNVFEMSEKDITINKANHLVALQVPILTEVITKPGFPAHIRDRALQVIEEARKNFSPQTCPGAIGALSI